MQKRKRELLEKLGEPEIGSGRNKRPKTGTIAQNYEKPWKQLVPFQSLFGSFRDAPDEQGCSSVSLPRVVELSSLNPDEKNILDNLEAVLQSINFPCDESGCSIEQKDIIRDIDSCFLNLIASQGRGSVLKIYQKRLITSREGYLGMGYDWKYSGNFQLSWKLLNKLQETYIAVQDICCNPTGGCCSEDSNKLLGIATPCYCDFCKYDRETKYLDASSQSKPIPRTPAGSQPRLVIWVKK